MKKIFISLSLLFLQGALFGQDAFNECNNNGGTQSTYLITYKEGDQCSNGPYVTKKIGLDGSIQSDTFYMSANDYEVNGIGLNVQDGFSYGMTYFRTGTSTACAPSGGISLFRQTQDSMFSILGTITPPSYLGAGGETTEGTIFPEIGTVDGYGDYVFLGQINFGTVTSPILQLYAGRIPNIKALVASPGTPIQVFYTPITNNTCASRKFSDWAIHPGTGEYYAYGIGLAFNPATGATVPSGQLMVINLNGGGSITCTGERNFTYFRDVAEDNITGIMFGKDNFLYGVNSFNRTFYKIDPNTGVITPVSTIADPDPDNNPSTTTPLQADLASCYTSMTVLPIDFSNVMATNSGECKIAVNWDAHGVENGDKFYIERSYDGRMFSVITSFTGVPNTTRYSFTDTKPGPVNYYRIKGVSKDGAFKYSSIVRSLTSCGGKNSVSLFSNPILNKTLMGEISLFKTQPVSYNVISATGARVFTRNVVTVAGVSRFNFNVPTLAKGLYLLQVNIGNEVKSQKFIVQ